MDSYQTSYLKINSKWIKELNVRNKTLRRKCKDHFHDLGSSNDFSDAHLRCIWECPKAWTTKAKVDKEHYIKLTNFCASKDIINRMKRQPTKWEKIFANHIYYFNFGKGLEQTCSKDDTQMACKHMKDASNTNHQKCKSKPQWDIILYLLEQLLSEIRK